MLGLFGTIWSAILAGTLEGHAFVNAPWTWKVFPHQLYKTLILQFCYLRSSFVLSSISVAIQDCNMLLAEFLVV